MLQVDTVLHMQWSGVYNSQFFVLGRSEIEKLGNLRLGDS